ncbi:MAG: hypothetical protein RML36_15445 [Anaerolineae bacterium]|nr:hypothetical protein [Anaerolineae bacterium]
MQRLPPFGCCAVIEGQFTEAPCTEFLEEGQYIIMRRGDFSVILDRVQGKVVQIKSREFPEGLLGKDAILELQMVRNGTLDNFEHAEVSRVGDTLLVKRRGREGAEVCIYLELAPEVDALDVKYEARNLPRPDGGMNAALSTIL